MNLILRKFYIELVRSFASHKSIIVARPDRGNDVAVLDSDRYPSSMVVLISDVSKIECICEPLKKITCRFEDKINRLHTKLKPIGTISDKINLELYASRCDPDFLYSLRKVYKANFRIDFPVHLFLQPTPHLPIN